MKLIDLFPTTIAISKLDTLTPDVTRRTIELIDGSAKVDMGAHGSYTTEQNFLEHPVFTEVKAEIIELCKAFSASYSHEVEGIGICNSWGNVVAYGQGIPPHKHNNSYISGSFYLTHGSYLSIANPGFQNLFGFAPKITANNFRSWEAYTLNPEPGMVVVFPSGLHHGVAPSRSTEKRYSVAFNAIPLGLVGRPTSYIEILTRDIRGQ